MKFNWGTGIALFYGTFVVVLVYFVIKSTGQDNSLVSDQYYADDLNYQQHYNKLSNARQLASDLDVVRIAEREEVQLQFPGTLGAVRGEITFFCPSDETQDFKVPVQVDSAFLQVISSKKLKRGLWRVKVNWEAADTPYYREEIITLK